MSFIPCLKSISIEGFRGFADRQTLNFAMPTGMRGSGLTVLVGPNSSGKSSIIEAITAITQAPSYPPTFSEGKRNLRAGSRVEILLEDSGGRVRSVSTVRSGGSETKFSGPTTIPASEEIFILPSRRTFAPFFGKSESDRRSYVVNQQKLGNTRQGQSAFAQRIFHINSDPEKRHRFNSELKKVLNPVPDWTIEQSEQGNYYLKLLTGDQTHSSDGLGEGIISAFFIVDALYDSEPGSMIVIDEPELSLHPQLQAKMKDLFLEKSADRQIVVSTHSPKFMDWTAVQNGAAIARTQNDGDGIKISELSEKTRSKVSSFLSDMNNPHVLGLDASEVFFLPDRILLVEGQEDVIFLPRVLNSLGIKLIGSIYGWGVGGADKMNVVASILSDLGFSKIAGLLDNDKAALINELAAVNSGFLFVAQPADDIRNNPSRKKTGKTTLLQEGNKAVNEAMRSDAFGLFLAINRYFLSR